MEINLWVWGRLNAQNLNSPVCNMFHMIDLKNDLRVANRFTEGLEARIFSGASKYLIWILPPPSRGECLGMNVNVVSQVPRHLPCLKRSTHIIKTERT